MNLRARRDSRLYFRFLHHTKLRGRLKDDELKRILIELEYIKPDIEGYYIELKPLWPRDDIIEVIESYLAEN